MVLLGHVEDVSADGCTAGWTVPGDSPWVEDGRLLRAAFLEIAAQTAAAHAGALDAADEARTGARPRLGWIGEVAGFRIHDDARPGDVLVSTVRRVAEFGPAARYECRIERVVEGGPTLLAAGLLTVVRAGGTDPAGTAEAAPR